MAVELETPLSKYLKANTQSQVMSKGRSIFRGGSYKLKSMDISGRGFAEFRVESEYYGNKYLVEISDFNTPNIKTNCSCPYNLGGICKHRVAAILYIIDRLPTNFQPTYYQMLSSVVTFPHITDEYLKEAVMPVVWTNRNSINTVKINTAKDGLAECTVVYKKEEWSVRLLAIQNTKQIHTSCSCNERIQTPLCAHKLAAFRAIRERFGDNAFDMMRDWTADKNKMLAEYGFSMNDELKGKFDFKITGNGQLQLLKLDPTIQKIGGFQNWKTVSNQLIKPQAFEFSVAPVQEAVAEEDQRVMLYNFWPLGETNLFDFGFAAQSAKLTPKTKKLTFIRVISNKNYRYGVQEELPDMDEADMKLLKLTESFKIENFREYARKQQWGLSHYFSMNELAPEYQQKARAWVGKKLEQVFQKLGDKLVFRTNNEYVGTSSDLNPITVLRRPVKPYFILKEEKDFVSLEPYVDIEENKPTELEQVASFKSYWLGVYRSNTLFKWATPADAEMVGYFRNNGYKMRVKKEFADTFLTDWVIPMTEQFDVTFQTRQAVASHNLVYAKPRLYLKEDDENLLVVPMFLYENPDGGEPLEFMRDQRRSKVSYDDDKIVMLERNPEAEKMAWNDLKTLHPDFADQDEHPFFYVPFNDVMKDNWLFGFFDELKQRDMEVLGQKDLRKMKFNPNRGKFNIRASSGIDWFDMEVGLDFGDQHVSLSDAKKALLKKQNYVELKDGTLGLLPEDWIKRIEPLLKFGVVKGDNIKLSKMHFSLIDELTDEIDNYEIQQELFDKKQKLLNFKEIQSIPLPSNLKAELRHYQEEGYKWLNFLDDFGWGGCLADDMGLGKTLQVLAFLLNQKNQNPEATNLVVVPTTLIFNWQAEAKKFAPDITIHVHRGLDRTKKTDYFNQFDIILTTYGTMRSDVELLQKYKFNYIVLDESQAVKNPDSLTSKAVRLLKAKNRITMTGTPVENNTFDLYSQMEFLNPGFLGGGEFFKSEYANPIDKFQDKEKAAELRKLIYPFMLKRTKEEVAKDLPDKTETILYCEMGKKQRKVYETFREKYRQQIADKMATEGMNKSSFLILEALMKLRQICDSPALLSDDADYGNESAKLDEITREIEENASNHKILIFSQFLKMLDLIKAHLEKNNIPYEYLDGQTTDRADRVNRFQNDSNCRVFLMSLKAGGVGLNLTEADYVYLIDPWWNPAVEAQAIDRTHRIGQTKKVFAYKMICKDSVEEKILLLQQRKKDLADDLISAEAGFIKKLSQEDIVDLFS